MSGACAVGEEVGYAEVDHWMWRMFLDDYGSTCESLGLPTLPLSLDSTGALPPPTPLLYGISPLVIPRQPYWPDRCGLYPSSQCAIIMVSLSLFCIHAHTLLPHSQCICVWILEPSTPFLPHSRLQCNGSTPLTSYSTSLYRVWFNGVLSSRHGLDTTLRHS